MIKPTTLQNISSSGMTKPATLQNISALGNGIILLVREMRKKNGGPRSPSCLGIGVWVKHYNEWGK